jgi:hypothetical protein
MLYKGSDYIMIQNFTHSRRMTTLCFEVGFEGRDKRRDGGFWGFIGGFVAEVAKGFARDRAYGG